MIKKTRFLTLALFACFVFGVSAQELQPQVGFSNEAGAKANFKKNKAGDNWFVSIAGGASVLVGDDNAVAGFGDRISINPQLSIGKWFKPYWGFRLQLMGGPLTGWSYGPNRSFVGEGTTLTKQGFSYFGAHLDYLLDVTNLWTPYN